MRRKAISNNQWFYFGLVFTIFKFCHLEWLNDLYQQIMYVTKEINSLHHPYLIKWDHLCEFFWVIFQAWSLHVIQLRINLNTENTLDQIYVTYVIIYLSIMFNHISLCKSKYTKNITMYIYFYDPCSDWVQDWPPLYIHKKDEREYEYSDGIINSKEIKINTQVIMIVVD